MIVSIEGIDGAGKNTLVTELRKRTGAEALCFPRYDVSRPAQLAARALHGDMGDLTDSIHGMATLFALDRYGAAAVLDRYRGSGDLLLLDRYVASNAAYSAARAGDLSLCGWVADLEFGELGLPVPDLQVLLDTPVDVAASRAESREASDSSRTRDRYESDRGLQERTLDTYRRLAAESWCGPWLSVDAGDTAAAARAVVDRLGSLPGYAGYAPGGREPRADG
ncbi:dTMP kinase [Corynebacterium pygosceleis]|uniref:Thymidylate kinase n=1 Tax=Corynebacterium pygosceleis TaxID=2800406 RepID=A0A9Q4C8C0_9CORY|nr:dTMP kinase [Corynebacterium pygosceleis]MCK7637703.1 dTMP kinase [Corynebacterium pygosceleis]MCK7674894.1 dTMP kinase [Corynebacterium pygosceleis]MCL0119517.1 dTMP kinase [Corynebacterium pygosceleis]MCX7444757.1 dTMP kinase [Corynebacterium pygosceleis]MCX7467968.1 dTMP kinase [Corynebacterium pygosceleis]